MSTSPPERGQRVKVTVDRDPVPTSFEPWAKPGHFDRTLARGPKPPPGFGIYMPMLTILIPIPVI